MKLVENFIVQWINFGLLAGFLFYILRKPLREFLSGRRERLRVKIVKGRHAHETAVAKLAQAKTNLSMADKDAEKIKRTLIETGTYGADAMIAKAKEAAQRIRRDAHTAAEQDAVRTEKLISKNVLRTAFDLAHKKLTQGISGEDQDRLLTESLTILKGIKENGQFRE
jgi:F-type H+-transporting ATPase subunit b